MVDEYFKYFCLLIFIEKYLEIAPKKEIRKTVFKDNDSLFGFHKVRKFVSK